MTSDIWKPVDQLAETLQDRLGHAPEIALVLGSGLGTLVDALVGRRTIETDKLPHWPSSTVDGHAGSIHWGQLNETPVLVQQGRVHLYEGYRPQEVVRPLRAAITWGVKTVILTNAAGGINPTLDPGGLMLIVDHLNLTGASPLQGPNDDRRGPRFPDLSNVYDSGLCEQLLMWAARMDVQLNTGIYAGLLGPTYETPAEVRMLSTMGADAVGMSTVLEAIAATHLGARVVGISCITNRAAGLEGAKLDHEDVQRAGAQAVDDLTALLTVALPSLGAAS